jgi:hypothetical protein
MESGAGFYRRRLIINSLDWLLIQSLLFQRYKILFWTWFPLEDEALSRTVAFGFAY